MKILLIGADGQVGWELHRTLSLLGEVVATSRSGRHAVTLDVRDRAQVDSCLNAVKPQLIVNASAYTAVDRAETEQAEAQLINAALPEALGRWAAKNGGLVVHFSTDYVYPGDKQDLWLESDATGPLNVYGQTKLEGDHCLMASGANAIILRVSWVYSLRGSNFLLTMLRLMKERESLNIVDDQIGAPTWSRTIAQATAFVAYRCKNKNNTQLGECSGVYHLAPRGETSWFGFAEEIKMAYGLSCEIHPISARDYPTPAPRPVNSRLDVTKLERCFNLKMPDWKAEFYSATREHSVNLQI